MTDFLILYLLHFKNPEELGYPLLTVADTVKTGKNAQALLHRQRIGHGHIGRGKIGPLKDFGPVLLQVKAKNPDRTRCGARQAKQHVDDGCLARAIGAKNAEDFSCIDLEGHMVDGAEVLEVFGQVLNFDDGFIHDQIR